MSIEIEALIVSDDALAAINTLNGSVPRIRMTPAVAADGRRFLPVDLLTDCGPGQTWGAYSSLLHSLATGVVTLVSVPEDI